MGGEKQKRRPEKFVDEGTSQLLVRFRDASCNEMATLE
jgi:hypothetical protein